METYLDGMDSILSKLFAGYRATFKNPGILLSGGIDSSTAAFYLSENFSDYCVYSMGTANSKDREYVQMMSGFLRHGFTWVNIDRELIRADSNTVSGLLKKSDIDPSLMQMSLAMGYFQVFKKAQDEGITHIITGQGPDILLAGYHKYKASDDINAQILQDLHLLETDKKRDSAMASHFGITLHNPYLEDEFVDISLQIPAEYKLHEGTEKFILRELAKRKGLPAGIVWRPKKAFQYSTGLQNLMKKVVE